MNTILQAQRTTSDPTVHHSTHEHARQREAFSVRDCSLISLSTGIVARTLNEFQFHLKHVQESSIYHHFWGNRLQPKFDEPEYQNDFAGWVRHSVHDVRLAEQLAMVDPTKHKTLEDLRRELLFIIDQHLSGDGATAWVPTRMPFFFTRSNIVIFDTPVRLHKTEELPKAISEFSASSIFFHFIDARRRVQEGSDDFQVWIRREWPEHEELAHRLADIDPYFRTLISLRSRIVKVVGDYFNA